MYDPDPSPFNPLRLLILMVIAIIIVIGATVALNGNTSTEPVENNTTVETPPVSSIQESVICNNSYGTVTKMSSYGNTSSDVRVALIVGVDQKTQGLNSIVPTLENSKDLKYAYDIYVIKVPNSNETNNTTNDDNNLTLNEKTEALANECIVPDVINCEYNLSVDIHGVSDSNSFVFVPSEDTFTSKEVVSNISNNTNVGVYTPNSYTFAESVSLPLISNNIPSVVYMTNDYYSNGSSTEVSDVIHAIDNFDFANLLNNATTNDTSTTNDTYNQSSDDVSYDNSSYDNVTTDNSSYDYSSYNSSLDNSSNSTNNSSYYSN